MEALARLRKYPVSSRKVRLLVNMVRGQRVHEAQHLLKFSNKQAAKPLEKLLLTALANWKAKSGDAANSDTEALYIKSIYVDGAGMLKRIRPAPQGRAHRIRKRSSHITLVISTLSQRDEKPETRKTEKQPAKSAKPETKQKKTESTAKNTAQQPEAESTAKKIVADKKTAEQAGKK